MIKVCKGNLNFIFGIHIVRNCVCYDGTVIILSLGHTDITFSWR